MRLCSIKCLSQCKMKQSTKITYSHISINWQKTLEQSNSKVQFEFSFNEFLTNYTYQMIWLQNYAGNKSDQLRKSSGFREILQGIEQSVFTTTFVNNACLKHRMSVQCWSRWKSSIFALPAELYLVILQCNLAVRNFSGHAFTFRAMTGSKWTGCSLCHIYICLDCSMLRESKKYK